jgi:hypothetical protein
MSAFRKKALKCLSQCGVVVIISSLFGKSIVVEDNKGIMRLRYVFRTASTELIKIAPRISHSLNGFSIRSCSHMRKTTSGRGSFHQMAEEAMRSGLRLQ